MTIEEIILTPQELGRIHILKMDATQAKLTIFLCKAHKYIGEVLDQHPIRFYTRNCWSEGVIVYKRKDGQPINAEDLRALKETPLGQINVVHGEPGDMTASRHWECDSSD